MGVDCLSGWAGMYYEKSKLLSDFNAESGVQSLCQK